MGSPPQVRGKQGNQSDATRRKRITPAGAGKTVGVVVARNNTEDHPRRCGENLRLKCRVRREQGSPPQVRGKLCGKSKQNAPFGITPAGAGKTVSSSASGQQGRDHPRRCGENLPTAKGEWSATGSPPQVRGKRSGKVFQQSDTGITPAGAGKTNPVFNVNFAYRDHPRRCGENSLAMEHRPRYQGSPPQVRGKRLHHSCGITALRITPAGAGKTKRKTCYHVESKDHPRRCGENTKKIL